MRSSISVSSDDEDQINSNNQNQIPLFKIPLRKEILCEEPNNQLQFYVKELTNMNRLPEEKIHEELEVISQNLCGPGSKCLEILQNDYFDFLYSVNYHLDAQINSIKKAQIQLLLTASKSFKSYIRIRKLQELAQNNMLTSNMIKTQNQIVDPSFKTILIAQNSIKAYVYLLCTFLSENCKQKDKKEIVLKGRQKKNNLSASEKEIEAINSIQKDCLTLIMQFIEMDLHFFWPEHQIEEDFVNLFIKACFDMIENPQIIKQNETKQLIFNILQKCIEKYGSSMKYMLNQNSTKIINMLYNQESLAKPLSEFVGLVAQKSDNNLANEILRELTKQICQENQSHESSGVRNVSKFISKLSKTASFAVYINIGSLLQLFDCEAYFLRQALIKALSNIIQNVLNQHQDDENKKKIYYQTKQTFLDLLFKRILDKSSYCRSKVLKVFKKLSFGNHIPKEYYLDLLTKVIGRFRDQTLQVRRHALILCNQLVEIFALIFNVDSEANEKFLSHQQVQKELLISTEALKKFQIELKNQEAQLMKIKEEIINNAKEEDEEEIEKILEDDIDYQQKLKDFNTLNEQYQKFDYVNQCYKDYNQFHVAISQAHEILILMLSSNSVQDTVEAIKMFEILQKLGIEQASIGIRKMMTLVFSKDDAIIKSLIEAYTNIYFSSESSQEKAVNLIKLMDGATLTEVTCIEEMVKIFMEVNVIDREIIKQLVAFYSQIHNDQIQEEQQEQVQNFKNEQRFSLQLLRMICLADPLKIQDYKDQIRKQSLKLSESRQPDFILIKEAIIIFETIMKKQIEVQSKNNNQFLGFNFDVSSDEDKKYIFRLIQTLIRHYGTQDLEWFCATESALNCIFNLKSRNCHQFSKVIIDQLVLKLVDFKQESFSQIPQSQIQISSDNLSFNQSVNEIFIAQLYFVIGHVSIKILTFIEQLENDIKKCLSEQNQKKGGEENKNDKEDDLAQITGGNDAQIEEYSQLLHQIIEENLIQDGYLGKFLPQIEITCQYALQKYKNDRLNEEFIPKICILERSAILALCKMMCVSSQICVQNLPLIFQLLDSKIEYGVKTNIIVSLGDLFNRFPNIMTEKSGYLFKLLHDQNNNVRRQALLVITHLILNDMLKIKGEIVDICMLLEDTDENVKNQVKLFLHELHSKGQLIIYNLFPNAIHRLSAEFPDMSSERFENIAKNLLEYIQKEKQKEAILEKLIQKLRSNTSETCKIEWKNSSHCLSLMKLNEKLIQKTIDMYDYWKERMLDSPETKQNFHMIVQNTKKLTNPTILLKQKLDELENKINLGQKDEKNKDEDEIEIEDQGIEFVQNPGSKKRRRAVQENNENDQIQQNTQQKMQSSLIEESKSNDDEENEEMSQQ